MDLNQINTETKEGKLLMAALAIITTESRTNQTPFKVLDDCAELTKKMYEESPVPAKIKHAMDMFFDQLKGDPGFYNSWQSNIAKAFYDECKEQGSEMPHDKLHKLCNDAAVRFLRILTR